MRILFIGDVFGKAGRRALADHLGSLRERYAVHVCIANGENMAGGLGITGNMYEKLLRYGVDVVTGGNHSFANEDGVKTMNAENTRLLRPANYPPGNAGKGWCVHTTPGGATIGVINVQGRVFMAEKLDCPFRETRQLVATLKEKTACILVDFHAEATSEKQALFHYLDGSVSAVVGTHTHVQTADECVSGKGTAYISDVGMTGPEESNIGATYDTIQKRFLYQVPVKIVPSEKHPMINAVVVEVDDTTGRACHIERIYERLSYGTE